MWVCIGCSVFVVVVVVLPIVFVSSSSSRERTGMCGLLPPPLRSRRYVRFTIAAARSFIVVVVLPIVFVSSSGFVIALHHALVVVWMPCGLSV